MNTSKPKAPFKLTHKSLQRDSGEESGVYFFANGVLAFMPIRSDTVKGFLQKALAGGVNNMVSRTEAMLATATFPENEPDNNHG